MTYPSAKMNETVESVYKDHEVFLKKLRRLKPSDSSFSYWLSSAALDLCVNFKTVKLQNRPKHVDDLVEKVKEGLEQMKNKDLLDDLPEEERDRMEYCQELFTRTFGGKLDESKTIQSRPKARESNLRGNIEGNGDSYRASNLNGQQNASASSGQLTGKSKTDQLPEKYKSDVVLMQKIRSNATLDRKKWIRGLAILHKELFVVSEESSEVEVYDSIKFSLSRRWNLKELVNPKDIGSCNINECLYIFDFKVRRKSNEMLRIDPNGKCIKKWSTGDDWGEGLSVTDESNIILTLHRKNKLNEYSPDGQLIREIILPEEIIHPLHAIKLTNGDFLVSHGFHKSDLHRVCIMDADGKLKKSFGGKRGFTIGQMDEPAYLTVDGNGFVMVADRGNSRVLLLNSDLEFKREILSQERNEFRRPSRILLDESNGRLFVVENWGKGWISIFSL